MTRRVHYGDSTRWCLKPVTYKHLGGLRRRCRKPKYHQGACWGGIPVDDGPKPLKPLDIDPTSKWRWRARAAERGVAKLSKWLAEARHQLWSEYNAAGGDEEAGNNASLRARGKLIDRIDKVLKETRRG